jgi:hypothetical protein
MTEYKLTTQDATHDDYLVPVCPDCGQPQSWRGTQKLPGARAYDLYDCRDENCGLYVRTHAFNHRTLAQTA